MQDRLNSIPGYKVYLTRDDDNYITMGGRLRYAKYHNADLFLSLHLDASLNKSVMGHRIFVLSESGSQTKNLDIRNSLKDIRFDLQQAQTLFNSAIVANYININLSTKFDRKAFQVYQAGFGVLKSPTTPSVLIELGFIINYTDMMLLNDLTSQGYFIDAIVMSIQDYVAMLNNK